MSKLNVKAVSRPEDRSLPIFAEFDEIADRIRDQAFKFFASRDFDHGHALDDWLMAEREVCWPAAELVEEDNEFEIKVALAGFAAEEIDVTASPQEIIVRAAHETDDEEDDGAVTHFSEFRSNRVFRRFELPSKVRAKKVEAKYSDGLLKIDAPKMTESRQKPQKVTVSTAA